MRGERSILESLGLLTLGQVLAQLLNVWALIFLADQLGAHWFGVVQVGVAFLAYALTTAEWGMFALGIRDLSRLDDAGPIREYCRTHVSLLVVQALIVLGIGAVLLPRLPMWTSDPWILILYLLAVIPQIFNFTWIALGLERLPWVGAAKTLQSLSYAAFVLVLFQPLAARTSFPEGRWIPIFLLVSMTLSNLFIGSMIRRWMGESPRLKLPSREEASRRWREATPIGANTVIMRVLRNIDLIVLGVLSAPAVAGNYAAASRVVFFLIVAMEVLWNALLPRLSRLFAQDTAQFHRSFNLYLGYVIAGLLPIAVGGYLVGPELLRLVYSGKYDDAGPVFQTLAISYSLLAISMFLGNTLVATNRQRAYFLPLVATATLAIVATSLFIPEFGARGASWGMLLAHTSLLFILVGMTRALFSNRLVGFAIQIGVAALVMGMVVTAVGPANVLVQIALGAAVYLMAVAWPLRQLPKRLAE